MFVPGISSSLKCLYVFAQPLELWNLAAFPGALRSAHFHEGSFVGSILDSGMLRWVPKPYEDQKKVNATVYVGIFYSMLLWEFSLDWQPHVQRVQRSITESSLPSHIWNELEWYVFFLKVPWWCRMQYHWYWRTSCAIRLLMSNKSNLESSLSPSSLKNIHEFFCERENPKNSWGLPSKSKCCMFVYKLFWDKCISFLWGFMPILGISSKAWFCTCTQNVIKIKLVWTSLLKYRMYTVYRIRGPKVPSEKHRR
jgi:hypothetical protein